MNGNQLLLIFSMNVPPQDEEILRKVKSFFITDGEEWWIYLPMNVSRMEIIVQFGKVFGFAIDQIPFKNFAIVGNT